MPKQPKDYFEAFLKGCLKRKLLAPKLGNLLTNHCRSLDAATPIHSNTNYLRDPAAKDNSIAHAAAARSNLDAAITMRSAETDLRSTIELRATASEIAAPKPDPDAKAKKRRF